MEARRWRHRNFANEMQCRSIASIFNNNICNVQLTHRRRPPSSCPSSLRRLLHFLRLKTLAMSGLKDPTIVRHSTHTDAYYTRRRIARPRCVNRGCAGWLTSATITSSFRYSRRCSRTRYARQKNKEPWDTSTAEHRPLSTVASAKLTTIWNKFEERAGNFAAIGAGAVAPRTRVIGFF